MTIIDVAGSGILIPGHPSTTVSPKIKVRNKGCCADYTPEGCAAGTACCCYNADNETAVVLVGDFGNALPPGVAAFVGEDPTNRDAVYGARDTLLVSLDMATDRARGDPFGGKSFVDDLFYFSIPVGDDYSGEWINEDAAILITILEPPTTRSTLPELRSACVAQAVPQPGCLENVPAAVPLNVSEEMWRHFIVFPRGDGVDIDGDGNTGDMRSRAGTSAIAGRPPVAHGELGAVDAPVLLSFTAKDPTNGDEVYGAGDELTVVFDRALDWNETYALDRHAVDALFAFSTPLGAAYRGTWNETSAFTITIDDASGAGSFSLYDTTIELGATVVHPATGAGARTLRNRAGCPGTTPPDRHGERHALTDANCLAPAVAAPPALVGDWGVLKPPPKFFGVWASDYDNGDAFYSANDSFTAYFDVPTDRGADATGGAREGGMGFVDLLLNFSHPLGNSYEGRWHDDDKAFTVTIRDAGNGTVSMTPKFRNCTADRVTGGTVIDERYGKPCTFGEIYVHDPATTVSLRAPVRTRGGGCRRW